MIETAETCYMYAPGIAIHTIFGLCVILFFGGVTEVSNDPKSAASQERKQRRNVRRARDIAHITRVSRGRGQIACLRQAACH